MRLTHPIRALCLGILLGLGTPAAATLALGRTHAESAVASPRKPAAKRALSFKARTDAFATGRVSPRIQRHSRTRPVLAVPPSKVGAYTTAMQADTIEVVFSPDASQYGHLEVRIGDRMFDMPGWSGAQENDFASSMRWGSNAYGFVFKVGKPRVRALLQAYRDLMATNPEFSIMGTGHLNCYSCAGFVTSVLADAAPNLGVRATPGAVSAASSLLSAGAYDALALYGSAADQIGSDDFTFTKLD